MTLQCMAYWHMMALTDGGDKSCSFVRVLSQGSVLCDIAMHNIPAHGGPEQWWGQGHQLRKRAIARVSIV